MKTQNILDGIFCIIALLGIVDYFPVHSADSELLPIGKVDSWHSLYLPTILRIGPVPEINPPDSRWPYSHDHKINVTYRWDSSIPEYSVWRYPFEAGITSWDNTGTLVNFYYHSGSANVIMAEYLPGDNRYGLTRWVFQNGTILSIDVVANTYWDIIKGWSNNQRQAIAAHEIGHLQLIGEIPFEYPFDVLMKEAALDSELERIFTPQIDDLRLVNQVYP